jgi:hypothetical protein
MNVMSLVITPTQNQKTAPVRINLDRMKSAFLQKPLLCLKV